MNANDEGWFRATMERFQSPLIAYALRFVKNPEKAREVVQEAFMKLCEKDRVAIEPYLAEWLYTVCRNKAIDMVRKDSRLTSLETVAKQVEGTVDSAEETYSAQEDGKKVMELLSALPENQQEVVRLKFQSGLSYAEISKVTGLSVTNVGFLIHSAMKKLKKAASKKGGFKS